MFQKSQSWNVYTGTITIYLSGIFDSGVVGSWTHTWEDKSNGNTYACELEYKPLWTDYDKSTSICIGSFWYRYSGSSWSSSLYFHPNYTLITGNNNNYSSHSVVDPGTGPVNGKTYALKYNR